MTKLIHVFLFLCIAILTKAQQEFQKPALVVEYDSAIIFRNLKLIPIKRTEKLIEPTPIVPSTISLKLGLASGDVKLRERGNYMIENIHLLRVENKSGKALIIKSGEMVIGGRQDRVFAVDTVLSSGKEHLVPVFCIEENRWSSKEKKITYKGVVGSGLQAIIDSTHSQTKVWNKIRCLLIQYNQTSSSSYAALQGNKKNVAVLKEYSAYLLDIMQRKDSSIVGIIASTGNQILGSDIFVSPSLFYQEFPSLLTKYCTEAILTGIPATTILSGEIEYANKMLLPETQPDFLLKKGKRFFYKGVLMQITGFPFVY